MTADTVQYNLLNCYLYDNKSSCDSAVDCLAYPITGLLCGKTVTVGTGNETPLSCGVYIGLLALTILLLPFVLTVSLAAFIFKALGNEAKRIDDAVAILHPHRLHPEAILHLDSLRPNWLNQTPAVEFTLGKSGVGSGPQTINKKHVYDLAIPANDHVRMTKHVIKNIDELKAKPLFADKRPLDFELNETAAGFTYPESNEEEVNWTCNFADSHLFGFCKSALLAQDELQVLEHPALYHFFDYLSLPSTPRETKNLGQGEIALITGAKRYCSLNTSIQVPVGGSNKSLYGNSFSAAPLSSIEQCLTLEEHPKESHIFAMAAPHIPGNLAYQPYQKKHLEALFYTALTAFSAIKGHSENEDVRTIIHTGNWGCGAFGNDLVVAALIQFAAASFAEVDSLIYYPMSSIDKCRHGVNLFEIIKAENPDMTVGEFCDYLALNANRLNLRYGVGNGT
jgi:hypothetical protein